MNIKAEVFKLLDENPLLSTLHICDILKIAYKKKRQLIWNYRYLWKTNLQKQIGSKFQRPSFHKPVSWVYVDRLNLSVEAAVRGGWIQTKAKNRYLLFRSPGLGHMKWFPTTGRVNLHTKKPHIKGRLFQLFCNGFSMNGLIDSMVILDKILKSIRFKGAHAVFGTPERLPYMEIRMFKLSNGVIIKMGDRSHPHAIEVEYTYPDWAEKNEQLLGKLYAFLRGEPVKAERWEKKRGSPFYVS